MERKEERKREIELLVGIKFDDANSEGIAGIVIREYKSMADARAGSLANRYW